MVRPYPENSFKAISIFILPWVTGLWLTPQVQPENSSSLDVAIIQPNIHLNQKRKPGGVHANIQSLLTMSDPAIQEGIDLIVWPESATAYYIFQGNQYYLRWIQSELENSQLLSGIPYYTGNNPDRLYYNSTILISSL